jgi:hypothetical protein
MAWLTQQRRRALPPLLVRSCSYPIITTTPGQFSTAVVLVVVAVEKRPVFFAHLHSK